jgi:trehalose 6-phosphate synthase/phosphatase
MFVVVHGCLCPEDKLTLGTLQGTLTPIVQTPSMAIPSNNALEALSKITADAKNTAYVISGRDHKFLDLHLGDLKGLGMSAEHGGFLREPGGDKWVNLTENVDLGWMDTVRKVFEHYTEVNGFFFPS